MTADEPLTAPEMGNDADAWFSPGRFALLLAVMIGLTFPGIILGQETFYYRDFGVFGYPLAQYQRECFWRGELPLWNPLNCCGLPFLAQWNTLSLYPPALFYLVFPLSWSLGVFNLGHLFLAGIGMYFLARRWTGNSLAAAVAGTLFAFNGLTWHSLMWPNDIAGLGWMPWVVLTAERAWQEGGRRVVWAALVGALQMLAGAPEIILLTWLFVGLVWLTEFFGGEIPWGRLTRRFASVVLLVAGLTAAQLLPFLDLLTHSHRDARYSGTQGWAMPASGLANFLAPLFHCYPASQGVFMQHDQYWIASYFLGGGALVLAAAALWRPRNARVWLLALTTAAAIWMALGANWHLYSLVNAVLPVLGFMRYPIKFVVLAVLIVPLLAAYGVKRCEAETAHSKPQQSILTVLVGVMLGLLALIAWVEWKYPEPLDVWAATWHNIVIRAAFIVLIPLVLLCLMRTGAFKAQVILRLALLLLLWTDVRTGAPNLSPTVARSVYEPGLIRTDLKLNPHADPGEPRFMATRAALDQVHYLSVTNAEYDYLCSRVALFDNCNLLDDLPKTEGFYSLYLRETTQALMPFYFSDPKTISPKGFEDFLSISHISAAENAQTTALEWTARDTYLPIITGGQKPVFAADVNILPGLFQDGFNPREIVYLSPAAAAQVKATRTEAKIISPHIEAQRMTVTVDATAPALVVIAQSFYKPWRAYVDGNRVPLWRANLAFQALEVPAGRHEVKLAYVDRVFQGGAAVSLATLLALAVIWFKQRPRAA